MDREHYHVSDGSGEDVAALAARFVPLAAEGFLVPLANKGLYQRAVKDFGALGACTLAADGGELRVDLGGAQVTLRENVGGSVCSCPSKTVCRHILTAVLCAADYASFMPQAAKPAAAAAEPDAPPRPADPELPREPAVSGALLDALRESRAFTLGVLRRGVSAVGETDAAAAAQLSLRLETQGAGNLARQMRALSADFESLLGKNAAFSPLAACATLSRLHNTFTLLLRRPEDAARLIERGRSEYAAMSNGRFVGLGAYPWKTRSGYFGVTALCWHVERAQLCTYTASMAGFYENTRGLAGLDALAARMKNGEHWAVGASMQAISTRKFTLSGFGLSAQNRLSSAKGTLCEGAGKTALEDVEALRIPVPGAREYDYFGRKRPEEARVVLAEEMAGAVFDKAAQVFHAVVGGVEVELAYSPLSERAIARLESLGRRGTFERRAFVCLQRRGRLVPVSMVSADGVENFYF